MVKIKIDDAFYLKNRGLVITMTSFPLHTTVMLGDAITLNTGNLFIISYINGIERYAMSSIRDGDPIGLMVKGFTEKLDTDKRNWYCIFQTNKEKENQSEFTKS